MTENKITITLSDEAVVDIAKILSSMKPTGSPMGIPMNLLGALGGLPIPKQKLEDKPTEEKPTIGFKLKGK